MKLQYQFGKKTLASAVKATRAKAIKLVSVHFPTVDYKEFRLIKYSLILRDNSADFWVEPTLA
jgi:hypothetical protein